MLETLVQKHGLWRWLGQGENRVEKRRLIPDLVAYYWNGSLPSGDPIRDVSSSGAFIVTEERWHVGTLLMITVQSGLDISQPFECVTVPCQIVRHASDGVGVKFMLTTKQERLAVKKFIGTLNRTSSRNRVKTGTSGEAIVEFALMVPLIFLLLVNAFNFGGFIYCWITIADAARAASDYACTDNSTADAPPAPNVTAITTLVTNATAGLPNASNTNPSVTVCEYNNGTTTNFLSTSACPTGVTAPPADPEPIATGSSSTYATVAVDVTYTFTPLLAQSKFLRFGLPALPSTIHRRTVVRWP